MQIILQRYIIISCIIYVILFSASNLYSQNVDDSWNVVRKQFRLNHQLHQPAVQRQLHWLISHPKYLNKLAQAEPYIYHIITEIQKKHLPGEIALIPMLESAYNPFAYSGAGAAGLWQLMPKTGKHLGIHGDWWVDGRRNIPASTQAALNYFTHLNRFFHGDWLLAIAAYDCGEGNIQRLIRDNPGYQHHFWYLPLPQETQLYVPRLLALAEIIAHPQHYQVKLPYIPHQPYFEEVSISGQIDLNHAAHLAGINFKDLIKLNPGFNHWTTAPNLSVKLLIPKKHVLEFNRNLAKIPYHLKNSLQQYAVRQGDSLASIAQHFQTNPQLIKNINHLNKTTLKVGQILQLPAHRHDQELAKYIVMPEIHKTQAQPIAPRTYKILHIIQRQQNLIDIAKLYRVSPKQLVQWNQLTTTQLHSGQKIFIWKQTNGLTYYIVKPGDTLTHIAHNSHLSLNMLQHLNPNLHPKNLKPGQKIKII